MGQLADYKVRSETVTLSEGTKVNVRGLSLTDLGPIMNRFDTLVEEIYAKFVNPPEDDKDSDEKEPEVTLSSFTKEVILTAPELVTAVIAAALDEADEKGAGKLAAHDQMLIVSAVFRQTLGSEGSLKNLAGALVSAMDSVSDAMESLNQSQSRKPPKTGGGSKEG